MMYKEAGNGWKSRLYVADPAHADAGAGSQPRLSLLGRFTSSGHFAYDQVSPCVAVHLVRSGRGTIRSGGTEHSVGAGDVFAFFPGIRYRYQDHPESPWRYAWCVLDGRGAAEALSAIGITPDTPALPAGTTTTTTAYEPLLTEVQHLYARSPTPPLFPVAAAWRLLDLLDRQRTRDAVADRRIAAAARNLMDLRFMTGITVNDVARHLEVDRSTLFRRFHSEFGVSPKRHLDGLRLHHARRLLRDGTTVAETAALSGYTDAHYFSRAYRSLFGYPPSKEPP
ncbi:MAG TPA: AraC family transcriptional regulator [Candidatus Limnocylindrales bacterium]